LPEEFLLGFNPSGPFALSLVTFGEALSLVLIIVAFGLIAALSMRSRTTSSFQFELYVFILVVVLAELPKIASDLGLIPNIQSFVLPGLIIHSISMAFLSGFVLWRASKAFGKKPSKKGLLAAAIPPKEQGPSPTAQVNPSKGLTNKAKKNS
jgi:hypothetical protein